MLFLLLRLVPCAMLLYGMASFRPCNLQTIQHAPGIGQKRKTKEKEKRRRHWGTKSKEAGVAVSPVFKGCSIYPMTYGIPVWPLVQKSDKDPAVPVPRKRNKTLTTTQCKASFAVPVHPSFSFWKNLLPSWAVFVLALYSPYTEYPVTTNRVSKPSLAYNCSCHCGHPSPRKAKSKKQDKTVDGIRDCGACVPLTPTCSFAS